jgi:hypothetical protein
MPWQPEWSTASAAAQERHGPVPFYEGIRQLDREALLAAWAAEPDLDEPQGGRVEGTDAFAGWVERTRTWLEQTDARVRPVDLIVAGDRSVEEVTLELSLEGERRELPVAVVAERTDAGALTAVRVYHGLWPLIEGHRVRPPLLRRDPDLHVPDVIGDYQRALAAGDLEGVLATYEDDATVREPAGGRYVYRGKQQLRRIYSLQFADGGIPLEHCTLTDDGRAGAVEYNVARWGRTEIQPQAGVAVYVRGAGGKLAHGRIYDDVAPPPASDSSEN